MNDIVIVTVKVILDDLLRAMRHRTDCGTRTSDSDAAQEAPVTVGVIAASTLQLLLEYYIFTLF